MTRRANAAWHTIIVRKMSPSLLEDDKSGEWTGVVHFSLLGSLTSAVSSSISSLDC